MCQRRTSLWLLAVAAVVAVCAGGLSAGTTGDQSVTAPEETRALWVLRTSLTTQQSIDALIKRARDSGFNTLLIQVRGRGDAYYRNALEPVPADLLRQAVTFDPLASVIEAGHGAGLRVHAWINVNLISSAVELPTSRTHVVHRHPDWLMVPRDIAQDLARVPIASPAYVGKLARWTREQDDVEGLYASPILQAAQAHAEAVVRDITRRYPLDGIHFDYARYPTDRFDYSLAAIAQFRTSLQPSLSVERRRALQAAESIDLFAYPDAFPDEWRSYRVARMTALMARLRAAVQAERPSALVSVAIKPDRADALTHRLQDWGAWLSDGIVDAIAPMAYTPEPARFAEQIAGARAAAGSRAVWAGIGSYRLSPEQTIDNINTARRLGAEGIVLFSYDSLINPRLSAPDYLPIVGRAAFATRRTTDGSR